MRRYLAVLVTGMIVMGAAPAVAEAHVLSRDRAMGRAEIEAYDFADYGERYDWSCGRRTSAHSFRCIIASFDPDTEITCDAYVRVAFTSSRRYGTYGGSWQEIDCGTGNPYDL